MIIADPVTAKDFFGDADANQDIIRKRWNCRGDEQELLSCPRDSRSNCNHDRDAGVFCYGKMNTIIIYNYY